ncbi:GNAT family N-acetyltransferase, partial [Escherichia coli]
MKIETSRLLIRSYETTDMDDAAEFLLNEKTMAFIPERFSSKEEMALFLEKNKNHFFPVVLKEEDKVIGHLSFEAFFGNHSYEIGWVFNEDYHQKGYGKEAAKA